MAEAFYTEEFISLPEPEKTVDSVDNIKVVVHDRDVHKETDPMAPISAVVFEPGNSGMGFVQVAEKSPQKPINLEATAEETKIGKLIADNLVEDGATLQMGWLLYM